MRPNYGYDDSYDEYSFPPARNAYGDYGEDDYDCYFNDDDYLDMSDACSSSDCTGMLVRGTGTEDQLKGYTDVYRFGQPKNKKI